MTKLDSIIDEIKIEISNNNQLYEYDKGYEMCKKFINDNSASVIIDCGYSFKDGHSCGDFDPSQVSETTLRQISYTPTPHGTGVLTVCGLLENTIKAYKKRNKLE